MTSELEKSEGVYRPGGETPYDMPQEVFWDKTKDANVRRGQWVAENCPDVPVDEIRLGLVMQPNEVDQLDLSSRTAVEQPSINDPEEENSRSHAMNRALLRGSWQDVINPRTRRGDKILHEGLISEPAETYAGFAERLRPLYPEFADEEFSQEFHRALLSAIDGQLFQNKAKLVKLMNEQKSLQDKRFELEHFKEIFAEIPPEQPK